MKLKLNSIKLLFAFVWCENMVIALVRGFLPSGIDSVFDIFIIASVSLLFVVNIPVIISRLRFHTFLFPVFMIISILLTLLFGVAKNICYENLYAFFIKALPYFFAGILFPIDLNEQNDLIEWLYKLSLINVITAGLYVVYYIVSGRNFSGVNGDAMTMAYNLLPSFLLAVLYFTYKKSVLNVLAIVIGSTCLLIYGNRGSILCALCVIVFCVLFAAKLDKKKQIVIVISSIIFVSVVLLFMESILSSLSLLFERLGFSTRIFDSILTGTISDSNGRDLLLNKCMEYLSNNPFAIKGWYFDRYLLTQYAHNYFLELFVDYGVFLGTVIAFLILRVGVKSYKCITNIKCAHFVALLIIYVSIHLFVSSSILLDSSFYLLMGILLLLLDNRNIKREV